MEARELRLRNWVMTPEGPKQIAVIDEEINSTEEIKPIPLTEEWLGKDPDEIKEWKGNGADYQPETSKTVQRIYHLNKEHQLHLIFETWSWRKSESDEWKNEQTVFVKVDGENIYLFKKEVHWLQNMVFYLKGLELEFKK